MPIFEYACKDCGRAFEAIVANDSVQVECRHCHGSRVEKQLSTFAVSGGSTSSFADTAPQAGPCGRCGAASPGMCQMN